MASRRNDRKSEKRNWRRQEPAVRNWRREDERDIVRNWRREDVCPHCAWIRFDERYFPPNKGFTLYANKDLIFTCNNENGQEAISVFLTKKFLYSWSVIYGTKKTQKHVTDDFKGMVKCINFFVGKLKELYGYKNLNVLINSHKPDNEPKEHLHAFVTIDEKSDEDIQLFNRRNNIKYPFRGVKKVLSEPYENDKIIEIENVANFLDNATEVLLENHIDIEKSFYIFIHYRDQGISIKISTPV